VKAGVAYAHAPTEALERIIALRVHLDESTMSNGPLRVIPESHRFGVLSDTQVGEIAHATSAMNCLVAKGGVLAMRPLLIHSSLRVTGSGFRRVLHIEYAPDIEVMPGIFLAAA
jgi:ectoine hydroxylase-related dioxygenase (phytanoyl-CoA dioxygenase family)